MGQTTTREEFRKRAVAIAMELVDQVEALVVAEPTEIAKVDVEFRRRSGDILRRLLGAALSARGGVERVGRQRPCACGGTWRFKQHRPSRVETVLPGRHVELRAAYGRCDRCDVASTPLREAMSLDVDGFTVGLRELSALAAAVEPFEEASSGLLTRMAGVEVSSTKLQTLVSDVGGRCDEAFRGGDDEDNASLPPAEQAAEGEHVYVMTDGGMLHVDKEWHEAKLGLVFRESNHAQVSAKRAELLGRRFVGTLDGVDELERRLWRQVEPMLPTTGDGEPVLSRVVMLGDGAIWIWNMADRMLPGATQIVDFYHASEHLAEVARLAYGAGSEDAKAFLDANRKRLAEDLVEDVVEAIRFLGHRVKGETRETVRRTVEYFERNAERMRYGTFRARGLFIGSGAIESAIQHVAQVRMKRPGMRWKGQGARTMLALRAVYRSQGLWDALWSEQAKPRCRLDLVA